MFHRLAAWAARKTGESAAFLAALALIVSWATTGPLFQFSETWQLIINTTTTIITFLMVFLIQHQSNIDMTALHAKLDEIIRALPDADNAMRGIEERGTEQVAR